MVPQGEKNCQSIASGGRQYLYLLINEVFYFRRKSLRHVVKALKHVLEGFLLEDVLLL